MTDLDAIRARLAAVADVDWSAVERTRDEEEYYGHWAKIGADETGLGAVFVVTDEQTPEELRQTEAVIDFLRHAADDIRALLAERGYRE